MTPEKRYYPVAQMPTTEAAIRTRPLGDLYLVIGEPQDGGGWAVRTFVKPFADWVWGGALMMALGGFLSLSDRRYRVAAGARAAATVRGGMRRLILILCLLAAPVWAVAAGRNARRPGARGPGAINLGTVALPGLPVENRSTIPMPRSPPTCDGWSASGWRPATATRRSSLMSWTDTASSCCSGRPRAGST